MHYQIQIYPILTFCHIHNITNTSVYMELVAPVNIPALLPSRAHARPIRSLLTDGGKLFVNTGEVIVDGGNKTKYLL